MDGHQFEHFCAEVLEKNGFVNVEVTRGSGDHEIDILAVKEDITYAIQCKRYSSNIGNAAVQQAHTGKSLYQRDIAVVLTNQYFTAQAIGFCSFQVYQYSWQIFTGFGYCVGQAAAGLPGRFLHAVKDPAAQGYHFRVAISVATGHFFQPPIQGLEGVAAVQGRARLFFQPQQRLEGFLMDPLAVQGTFVPVILDETDGQKESIGKCESRYVNINPGQTKFDKRISEQGLHSFTKSAIIYCTTKRGPRGRLVAVDRIEWYQLTMQQ